MYNYKKILAIIPARGGSKGLPGKNVRDFSGRPLISWSIEAGLKSKYIDKVLVSTDSPGIQSTALHYGADVPFLRPSEFAEDNSEMIAVVKHALSWLKHNSQLQYDYLILLQPTSPLRSAQDIDAAIEHYFEKLISGQERLVSCYKVSSKYNWLLSLDKNNLIAHFAMSIDNQNMCRQKLNDLYMPNGAIYITKVDGFSTFFSDEVIVYEMLEQDSIDIDTLEDFEIAEKRHQIILKKNSKECEYSGSRNLDH